MSELLQCQALQGRRFTEEDVRKVTEDNDKQRFHLKVDPVSQKLMVRANQGHTIHVGKSYSTITYTMFRVIK